MRSKWMILILLVSILLLSMGCGAKELQKPIPSSVESNQIQIGMSFDTFVLERWLRDREVFTSTAAQLGAQVNVQNANGDSKEQLKQIRYLIDKKMDAIVIVPIDAQDVQLVKLLGEAKGKGIVVVCYDRLVGNADADLYISFDNKQVGVLMAQEVLKCIPEGGRIAAVFGPDTDANVPQAIAGVREVLEEQGQELVYENQAAGWKEEYAFEYINECLETVGSVDAIICGNDALASMALKALAEKQEADGVCIVGQDADILACQRIVEGYQHMTVYKPIHMLAKKAAQYTVDLVEGKDVKVEETMNDGKYEVPFCRLEPVAVTKENMDEVIIGAQFHLRDEVYLHVGD